MKGTIINLGIFSLWSQDDKKDEYKKALEQLAKTDQVTLLLKKAKLAEHKQDFQKAEDLYHQALAALKVPVHVYYFRN